MTDTPTLADEFERRRFEDWWTDTYGVRPSWFARDAEGDYGRTDVSQAWVVWQAAILALPPKPAERGDAPSAINAAVRAEREACANLAEETARVCISESGKYACELVANVIRWRATTPQPSAPAPEKE